jgi:hypothetical protein
MNPVPMGTHEKISMFTVGREIWEAIEKTVQELGSWMAEQGNVPLLVRFKGKASTTLMSDSEQQKRGKRTDLRFTGKRRRETKRTMGTG